MNNSEQPTFPIVQTNNMEGHEFMDVSHYGLSKREYFAAMAMQGMLANPEIMKLGNPDTLMNIVSMASVEQADDLLLALEKT